MKSNLNFFELEPDEQALSERSDEYVLLDDEIRVWLKRNRIGLNRSSLKRYPFPDQPDQEVLESTFQLLADADSDCVFKSLRLTFDFSEIPGAVVHDMSPREVLGQHPLKITVKSVRGLSFEFEKFKVGPSFEQEKSVESQTYFPEIRGLGIGFNRASWSFEPLPGAPLLFVDKVLSLLVAVPAKQQSIPLVGTIRVEVTRTGWQGMIPLLGRRRVEFEITG